MKRFRKVLIAALTAALLLLQTVAAFAGDGHGKRSVPDGHGGPTPASFPSDPGEPTT